MMTKEMSVLLIILTTLSVQNVMGQKQLEEKANIKFIGEYYTGRGTCQYLPDGTRRWKLIAGFKVKEIILGNIQVSHVKMDASGNVNIFENQDIKTPLTQGKKYLVSMRLDEGRIKILEDKNTQFTHLNLISKEEIVSITAINGE